MSQHSNDIALHRPTQLVDLDQMPGTTRGGGKSRTGGASAAPGARKEGTMADRQAAPEDVVFKVCSAHQRAQSVTLTFDDLRALMAFFDRQFETIDRERSVANRATTTLSVAKSEAMLQVAAARDAANELRRAIVQILRAHGRTIVTGQATFRDPEAVELALVAVANVAAVLQPLDEVDNARLAELHTIILTEDRS